MTTPARGGMCSNPFGGEDRIDRVNLLDFLESNVPSHKVLYARIIQDAASNYLYAFLGKNGTSIEEFFAAWQYFFKVVSTNKKTWDHHRTVKLSYTKKGVKVNENRYLSDNELILMCFDKHYEFSGLEEYMNIDKFREGLKVKRTKILKDNWAQVSAYVDTLYQNELNQVADGRQVPLKVWDENLLSTLVDPITPIRLASLIYIPTKLKRPIRLRTKKIVTKGMYARLVEKIENNSFQSIGKDWGPLSLFEGIDNEIVNNNSVDSVHSLSN